MDLSDLFDTDEEEQDLTSLAEEAVAAVDAYREAKSKAEALRKSLLEAMKSAGKKKMDVLGRTVAVVTTNRTQRSLKALKEILGEDKAKEVWAKFPMKPSDSVDIPTMPEPSV